MSQRSVKAGEAYIELMVKDEKFRKGLNDATARMKAFGDAANRIGTALATTGSVIAAMGAAILGTIGADAKVFADMGSALDDMQGRTGIAADKLSEWIYAAEQGGATAADLESSLRTMAKKGFDPQRFEEYGKKIASIEDPAERVVAALETFGKAGVKLLPALSQLDALTGEARSLGLTVDPATAAKADALGDALGRVQRTVKDLTFEIGAAVAGPLTELLDQMAKTVAAAAAFIQKNQEIVITTAVIGATMVAVGTTIAALGAVILGVAGAMSLLIGFFTLTATPVGAITVAVVALAASFAALVVGMVAFTATGRALAMTAIGFLGGIFKAIANGNILNAWGQLGTGMVIVWAEVAKKIKQAFFQAATEIASIMASLMRAVADQIEQLPLGKKIADELRGVAGLGQAVLGLLGKSSIRSSDATITTLQAQLDALRSVNGIGGFGNIKLPKLADLLTGISGGGTEAAASGLGGSAGTFNSAAAGLLGRSGGPMDRTAKEAEKQTDLQEKIKKLLEGIDEGITELDGFALQ